MKATSDRYWQLRLEKCKTALERNKFEAFLVADLAEAQHLIMEQLLPAINPRSVSWGDSMTLAATGVLDRIREREDINLIETFAKDTPREVILERRRQALLVDLFFTGTNALTETGKLVNLDMVGNRIAGITYGPRQVIITVGRNKLVSEVEEAMARIKNYAAPLNVMRHPGFKTPCSITSYCMDCASPDRICNTWAITEKSYPPGRIKVVLINQEEGL
jgi:L-lactate utilization protein LutB